MTDNKKTTRLKICDAIVQPGEIANLALQLPEQYSCSPLYMPIRVTQGVKPGPCLVVFSVLEGNELNGLEIANRVGNTVDPQKLSGTLITIPVVNVFGLTHYPNTLATVEKDISNCFPGNELGTFGERTAHLFTQEILKKADYCIELHTGQLNHNILPQVYCNFDNAEAKKLARAFQAPVITNAEIESNPLRQTTEELHIPFLVYEAGEAMRFDENAIQLGIDGIKNVMRELNMLTREPSREIKPIFSRDEDWIKAHRSGILHPSINLGDIIKTGDKIGSISDPFGTGTSEKVKSNIEGVVVGINTSPLIHEGMPIFKVLSFLDDDKARNAIEQWDQKQPDSYMQ